MYDFNSIARYIGVNHQISTINVIKRSLSPVYHDVIQMTGEGAAILRIRDVFKTP